MKTIIHFVLWSLVTITLTGCSNVPVNQDYDTGFNFSSISSVEWLPENQQTPPKAATFAKQNPLIAKRIQIAILTELKRKGITSRTPGLADAYVTYHYSTERVLQSDPFSTSVGLGVFGNHGGFMFQTQPDLYESKEGKLIIDIISRKGQLLWRGIGSSLITEQNSPQATTEQVNKVVASILAQYPPK
jgi:hypothetical protein